MKQLELFSTVSQAYLKANGPLHQDELYDEVIQISGLCESVLNACEKVGKSQANINMFKRKIRWYQQTLKHAGVIEPAGKRGVWQLTGKNIEKALLLDENTSLLGFSTDLGIAIISKCESFFAKTTDPIHLIITSPPYPLTRPRDYGNVDEANYVDWICKTIEPVVKNLVVGGSICINVGNDVFLSKSPARSLYRERLVLALHDRLGLYKMDELIWVSNKPPGPVAWASKKRVQLNVAYEPVYWFTNDPQKVRSNNQSVLQPHSKEHLKFVRSGGHKTRLVSSDGAYYKKTGAYSKETKGKIPKNVLYFARNALDKDKAYREYCKKHDLKRHGASMPVALADFLIRFLTKEGELVVDPMAGRCKVGLAAQRLGRRWICTDKEWQYIAGSLGQF